MAGDEFWRTYQPTEGTEDLVDKFQKAISGHLPGNYDYERGSWVIRKHPDLFRKFVPLCLERAGTSQTRASEQDVLELIEKAPLHAERLFPVFDLFPCLIEPYSYLIADDGLTERPDEQRGHSRISVTTDASAVFGHIGQMRSVYETLRAKMEDQQYVEASQVWDGFGVVDLSYSPGFLPGITESFGSVLVTLRPRDIKVADFKTSSVFLFGNGLARSVWEHHGRAKLGYLFLDTLPDDSYDERNLVLALKDFDFGSKELAEVIDADPNIFKTIEEATGRR